MSPATHEASETAALEPIASSGASPGVFWLVRLAAASQALRLAGPVSIGRDAACEIWLDDAAASRSHARLTPTREGALVEDCKSRNGTFVDGRRISSATLRAGSVLRVGETLFVLARYEEEPSELSLAGPLVGGTSLVHVRRTLALVAPTPLPVVVLGETGTGKEVVAQALHAASGRPGALVAVNCAALPQTLAESELFGHAQGAFTGAKHAKKGLFSQADRGTLFLDEVGELPIELQAKLLRVLEDGLIRPVGAERELRVDVRVVCATNRDMSEETRTGRFRSDLWARLSPVVVTLPPLRERREDLAALATYLLARKSGSVTGFDPDALEALALHDWPRNVRELDNVLKAAVLHDPERIRLQHLAEPIRTRFVEQRRGTDDTAAFTTTTATPRAPLERTDLERALRKSGGNVRQTAKDLSLSRAHLYRLLTRWELDPAAFRATGTAVSGGTSVASGEVDAAAANPLEAPPAGTPPRGDESAAR